MSAVITRPVAAADGEIRLDRWFQRHYPELSHGRLEKLLRTGQVRIDGKRAKASQRLAAGQMVRVPPLGAAPPVDPAAKSRRSKIDPHRLEELRRSVLYKDEWLIAIDKPAGLAVQGGSGTDIHLDAMLDALQFDAPDRPRLIHRLDKDTSGVLLLARSAKAAAELARLFRDKDMQKLYWAVVVGQPRHAAGKIDLPIAKLPGAAGERMVPDAEAGKRAITHYRRLDHAGRSASWLALLPITGRTHQLRVHCAAMGTPILGDGKYGAADAFLPGEDLPRQLHLHARAIAFRHLDGKMLRVVAPLPDHMRRTWKFLGFDIPRTKISAEEFEI